MSKMRMPEMSVVRFNESDVIVASSLTVSNAADGGAHNLTVTRDGKTIFYNGQYDAYLNDMSKYYETTSQGSYLFYFGGNDPVSLDGLRESDNNGTDYAGVDGDYYYDGQGIFRRTGVTQ
ncbi:MAG: hypothetical protein ILA15_08655 [Clostridiales bacterium]|nr:hypothetical protein [Clostridiales bacterium]